MSHGPECPLSLPVRYQGLTDGDCQCIACYCGVLHEPRRSAMRECARCYRPLVVDGRVVRMPVQQEGVA